MHNNYNGKSLTNRQIAAQLTKERIYETALNLIREKGYINVSIKDITDAAGVAKGSFYTHFRSKEHILRYSYVHIDQTYMQVYRSLPDADFLSTLCTFISEAYKIIENRGKEILKAITSNYFNGNLKDVYKSKSRNLYKCLIKIIEQGRVSGMINASVPDEEYVNTIIAALIGAETFWCLMDDADLSLTALVSPLIKTIAIGMIAQDR